MQDSSEQLYYCISTKRLATFWFAQNGLPESVNIVLTSTPNKSRSVICIELYQTEPS